MKRERSCEASDWERRQICYQHGRYSAETRICTIIVEDRTPFDLTFGIDSYLKQQVELIAGDKERKWIEVSDWKATNLYQHR